MKKGMATHSSILAWRIPWIENSGGLQSMGSHDGYSISSKGLLLRVVDIMVF